MPVLTTTPLASLVLGLSVLLSMSFFVYGINTLHLTKRARRYSQPQPSPLPIKPAVGVHLPVYNEFYVADRLLAACARMAAHYGPGLVRICVIDDSDDETSVKLDNLAAKYVAQGYRVEILRRGTRAGFKAGALQAALERTQEPFIAVFDADFAPPHDFLDTTVPFMLDDEKVGFVQCRWTHFDRRYNMITETLAIGVDAHFLLEQPGRWSSGYLMNFNGSAGLLRTGAIRGSGGWNSDTLAEDLDLSYRMQLSGYTAVYLKDLKVPAELPPTITSLKRQQGRWARGSIQTARKIMPQIVASKNLSVRQKFEAFVHLTYYMVHPLMVASFGLAVLATFLNVNVISYAVNVSIPSPGTILGSPAEVTLLIVPWAVFTIMIVLSTVSVMYYCMEAVRAQNLGLLSNVKQIVLLVILGYGISLSNSVSALSGLFSRRTGVFLRTPKYNITEEAGGTWKGKRYQLSLNHVTLLEALASVVGVAAMVYAMLVNNLGILPILAIYVSGYLLVLFLTLSHSASHS